MLILNSQSAPAAWYEDPGWPDPDPAEARRLVEAWEADNGDLEIVLVAIANQDNLDVAQAQDELWGMVGVDVDPDPDRIGAPGELSVNFSRYTSEVTLEALHAARETSDPEQRRALYAQVWRDRAENHPYLFLYHISWIAMARESIKGLDTFTFPDGEPAAPMIWGSLFLTDVWVEL